MVTGKVVAVDQIGGVADVKVGERASAWHYTVAAIFTPRVGLVFVDHNVHGGGVGLQIGGGLVLVRDEIAVRGTLCCGVGRPTRRS